MYVCVQQNRNFYFNSNINSCRTRAKRREQNFNLTDELDG